MEAHTQKYLLEQRLEQLRGEYPKHGVDRTMLEIRANIIKMGLAKGQKKQESLNKVIQEVREAKELEENVQKLLT